MCEHCEHEHSEHHHYSFIIIRVLLALLLFCAGFLFRPLFILAYVIAGADILFRAIKNTIKEQIFDENFLMGIATLGAIAIGEYPEAVIVMVLYQIGEYLQDGAVEKSRNSIAELLDIRPDYANLNGEKVPPQNVKVGEVILIKPGEKIPLDGVVTDGKGYVDTSALTGEAAPVYVKAGDSVSSGCINTEGVLAVKVTKIFQESTVSKILELVEHASAKKSGAENFITKFARYYTPAVVVLALLVILVPVLFFNTPLNSSIITPALTCLVVACPCALVISIPLSFFAGIGGASGRGILIKGGCFIEALSKTKTAVFDKTGTLTKGCFEVTKIVSDYPDFLKYAAFAESASSHPIACAIKRAYGGKIPEQCDSREFAGKGIRTVVEGKEILAGCADFTGSNPVKQDGTVIYVSIDGKPEGYIVISDEIKENAKDAIKSLNKLGISTVILTGDSYEAALEVKQKLGIDCVSAGLLPDGKVKEIEEIIGHSKGSVIFAGDGINDAPVLAAADVGIAMGAIGSDAAVESADVVIMDDNLFGIVDAIKISGKTMRIVKQNIAFAILVKVLFLFLGASGIVTMWGAVFADVGVSLIAMLNALRAVKK